MFTNKNNRLGPVQPRSPHRTLDLKTTQPETRKRSSQLRQNQEDKTEEKSLLEYIWYQTNMC